MRRIESAGVLLLLLLLTGCGSSPKSQFFALEAVPPKSRPAAAEGPAITLGSVRLPAVLDRLALVRQGQDNRLEISDRDRWGAPLDEMVRQVLTTDLAARLPPGMIVPASESKPGRGVRSVVVRISAFTPDASGRLVLDASWALTAADPHQSIPWQRERITIVGVSGFAAEPATMSHALGVLADRMAAALAARSS